MPVVVHQQLIGEGLRLDEETRRAIWTEADDGSDYSLARDVDRRKMSWMFLRLGRRIDNVRTGPLYAALSEDGLAEGEAREREAGRPKSFPAGQASYVQRISSHFAALPGDCVNDAYPICPCVVAASA